MYAYGDAVVGDDDDVVVCGIDEFEVDDVARLIRQISRLNALSGSALERILGDVRTLAVALLSEREHLNAVLDLGHVHDLFARVHLYRPHALARPARRAHVRFGKAYALAARGRHEQFVLARGELNADEFVALGERDGYLTVGVDADKFVHARPLDESALGRHGEVSRAVGGHGHIGVYLFPFAQREQVDHGASLAVLARFGDLPTLYAVDLALVAEKEQRHMRIGGDDVLDKVLFLGFERRDSHAAAALSAVFVHGKALDIAVVSDRDDDVFLLDEVFDVEIGIVYRDLAAALVGILVAYLAHLFLYYLDHAGGICENVFEVGDEFFKLRKFGLQLFHFEGSEPLQPHVENGVRLLFAQLEPLGEVDHRVRPVARLFQKLDHFVDVGESLDEPDQNMLSLLRLFKVELGAPGDHVFLMLDIRFEYLFEIEHLGRSVHQGEHDHGIAYLHLRMLEEQVEHDLRADVLFHFDDYPHAVAVGLLVNVAYALYPLLLDKFGYALDELGFVDLIGDLGDDDAALAARHLLYLRARTDDRVALARLIRLFDARSAHDERAGGIVGRGDIFDQLVDVHVGIVEQGYRAVDDFAQIVRRNGSRHAHGDAVRTVDEQVGIARGQNDGLFARVVEVWIKVHRLFLDVAQHFHRYLAQPRLGVAVSRGRIAVHAAEVTVTVDQGAANGEVLREPDQGVVNGEVAVGVELTEHVADYERALAVRLVRSERQLVIHIVKYPAVNGFQAVSHVGNGAGDVDRHGVSDEGLFDLALHVHVHDFGPGEHFFYVFFILFFHFSPLKRPSR